MELLRTAGRAAGQPGPGRRRLRQLGVRRLPKRPTRTTLANPGRLTHQQAGRIARTWRDPDPA